MWRNGTAGLRYAAALLVAISLSLSTARGAISGADNPKVYTWHDFAKATMDFHQRTLVDDYKSVGKRNAKWDEKASDFLNGMAEYFTAGTVPPLYVPFDLPVHDALVKKGQAAVDAGCDDPLVVYCLGAVLQDSGRLEDARPLLQRAIEGMKAGNYSPVRLMAAAKRMRNITPPGTEAQWDRMALDAELALMKTHGIDRRIVLVGGLGKDAGGEYVGARLKELLDAARKVDGADVWLLGLLEGKYHIAAAWEARGSGWGNTVTPEGWQVFFKELHEGEAALTKAWQLEPTYPEAPAAMIRVAMGGQGQTKDDARTWFDRATAAQLDYGDAYTAFLWSIRPRWGGSHQQMLQFGLECARTQRYDTWVPLELLTTIDEIDSERGDSVFWVGAYETVMEVLTKGGDALGDKRGGDALGDKRGGDAYYARAAALSWRLGKYKEARAQLDRGQRWMEWALTSIGASPERAIGEIHAMTGVDAEAVTKAQALARKGDYAGALAAYDELDQLPSNDAKTTFYVKSRLRELDLQEQFAKGEWVTMVPDASLEGWYPAVGHWEVDGESVKGVTDERTKTMSLICQADFGRNFEMQMKVESSIPGSHAAYAGPLIKAGQLPAQRSVGVDPEHKMLYVLHDGGGAERFPVNVANTTYDMRITVWNGELNMWLNGTKLVAGYDMQAVGTTPMVGLGGQYGSDDSEIRFSQIKIRKLSKPPANN